MIAHFLAFVAILFVGVSGQVCSNYQLDPTLFNVATVPEILCRPEFQVPTANLSAGYTSSQDLTRTFAALSSRGQITNEIYSCLKSFAAYYCATYFPSCGTNGVPVENVCAATCMNVNTTCSAYINQFIAAGELRVPTTDCDSLPSTNCYTPTNNTWVGHYYDNSDPPVPPAPAGPQCTPWVLNTSVIVQSGFEGGQVVCRPNASVPLMSLLLGYNTSYNVFMAFRRLDSLLTSQQPTESDQAAITDAMYPCIKALANYNCAKYYPVCNGEVAVPNVCRTTCTETLKVCQDIGLDKSFLFLESQNQITAGFFPTETQCNALPVPDPNVINCFYPDRTDTFVGFFYSNQDPPVPFVPTPTPEPTKASKVTDHPTPKGGYAAGGGLGAGVLVGLLLVIGLIMFIMKKQDSR